MEKVQNGPADQSVDEAELPPKGRCYDCWLPYTDPGFADLVVSPEAWKAISPTGHEGGLLCPTCMVRAAERNGIQCDAKFRSGPFTDVESLASAADVEQETCDAKMRCYRCKKPAGHSGGHQDGPQLWAADGGLET